MKPWQLHKTIVYNCIWFLPSWKLCIWILLWQSTPCSTGHLTAPKYSFTTAVSIEVIPSSLSLFKSTSVSKISSLSWDTAVFIMEPQTTIGRLHWKTQIMWIWKMDHVIALAAALIVFLNDKWFICFSSVVKSNFNMKCVCTVAWVLQSVNCSGIKEQIYVDAWSSQNFPGQFPCI